MIPDIIRRLPLGNEFFIGKCCEIFQIFQFCSILFKFFNFTDTTPLKRHHFIVKTALRLLFDGDGINCKGDDDNDNDNDDNLQWDGKYFV